jgi:hypothetical protein
MRNRLYRQYELSVAYNKTNVSHILFNLLRIIGLYMFRGLLAHPQEVLYKRRLVYCVLKLVDMQEDEQVMLETCRGKYRRLGGP